MSRVEDAGILMGDAIVEMVHLMYQKNTQKNFYRGLMSRIEEEKW